MLRKDPEMQEPTFDKDGYPTEETLITINESIIGVLGAYCHKKWYVFCDISNSAAATPYRLFWAVCWVRSTRGGYYEFTVPPLKDCQAKACKAADECRRK